MDRFTAELDAQIKEICAIQAGSQPPPRLVEKPTPAPAPVTLPPDEVLTVNEVARILKLHRRTVCMMTKAGKLPGFRVGRGWRFNTQAIREFISR